MSTLNSVESYTQWLKKSTLYERYFVRNRNNVSSADCHVLCETTRKVGAIEWTVVANVYHTLVAVWASVVEQNRVSGNTHTYFEVCRSILAKFSDNASKLMTKNCRERNVIRVEQCFLSTMQRVVSTANAACLDLEQYFVILNLRNRSILYILPRFGTAYTMDCVHYTFHVFTPF